MEAAFACGVASGDVGHGHVVLWTKVAPNRTVTWTCTPDDGDGPALSGQAVGDAATGSVHVPVQGLDAGRRYRYRFAAGDADSGDGWFRTIPTDRPVRFAVVCCAKYNSGFFNAYRAIAGMDDIDFVLHLGDYIYEAAEVPTGKQTPGANIGRWTRSAPALRTPTTTPATASTAATPTSCCCTATTR